MASDQALSQRTAANQAAARWTRGLLSALSKAGCVIHACSHCSEQVWPKGMLWPGVKADFDAQYPLQYTRYLNLPYIRFPWLDKAYRRMVSAEIQATQPDVVLAYNLESYHYALADIFRRFNIPWVPIILDQPDPRRDDWKLFKQQIQGASGAVFVSDWGFNYAPLEIPKLHLDGGVTQVAESKVTSGSDRKRIVYSGKYNHAYGGLDFLFAMFANVQRQDCELVLTGKDVHHQLPRYLAREPRARYLGYLSREALHQVYADAAVFVNPGNPDSHDNRMNFPSKLLDYLAYGKPIVSTWTAGMAREYCGLLTSPFAYTPQAYGGALEAKLELSVEACATLQTKILNWGARHTWDCQAQRLLAWLQAL